jgi:DNA polymerase
MVGMKLIDQILECKRCPELVANRKKIVVGEGPVPCPAIFLGEAPGREEDLTGIPFNGRAGDILNSCAFQAGLHRGIDFHILNTLKCRPPENRDPKPHELENCRQFLEQQIAVVKPKVVLAMGRYAMAFVLHAAPPQTPVLKNTGRVVEFQDGIIAVLTYHPAFLSRNQHPDIRAAFIKHLSLVREISHGTVNEDEMRRMLVSNRRK